MKCPHCLSKLKTDAIERQDWIAADEYRTLIKTLAGGRSEMIGPEDTDPSLWSVSEAIEHLNICPGCEICEMLVEDFMACDSCGSWGEKDSSGWDVIEGRPYCIACADEIRDTMHHCC
jgi:hypothetical protein